MDHVSKETRSRIMASVKSKGGKTTEALMGKLLRENGLRGYRKNWPVIGKPDFAWPGRQIAVFVDGCFWHGCRRCKRPPKTNVDFWLKKFADNRKRDAKVSRTLRRRGWKVIRVRECAVRKETTIRRIESALHERPNPDCR
jgi:DNA mismatch endonuclease (patch repair protein)